MTKNLSLETFLPEKSIELDPSLAWPRKAFHHFDREQAVALLVAKKINRPLLIRGEPGCGKTQIARAAAQVLKMPLANLVVNERTETEDLFWHYDALRRLSDANSKTKEAKDEADYLSAGPLWWAFNPEDAARYTGAKSSKPDLAEATNNPRSFDNGVLLLIDEIDKADRSVPNSLLEALGNYSFDVPFTGARVSCDDLDKAPLIVITTNNEQELPPAFVRRCLVLDIVLEERTFVETLASRGRALFADEFEDDAIFEKVAQQLLDKRRKLKSSGEIRLPGQAEYLDHLEALVVMKQCDTGQSVQDHLDELARLTYNKFDS